MAKKKKTHNSKKNHGKKRVGAIGGDALQMVMGAAVGAVAGKLASQTLSSSSTSSSAPSTGFSLTSPLVINGGLILAGYLVTKKSSKAFMKGMGLGLIGAGAIGEGQGLKFLNGIGEVPYDRNLAAAAKVPVVNGIGYPQPNVVGETPGATAFPSMAVIGSMDY